MKSLELDDIVILFMLVYLTDPEIKPTLFLFPEPKFLFLYVKYYISIVYPQRLSFQVLKKKKAFMKHRKHIPRILNVHTHVSVWIVFYVKKHFPFSH